MWICDAKHILNVDRMTIQYPTKGKLLLYCKVKQFTQSPTWLAAVVAFPCSVPNQPSIDIMWECMHAMNEPIRIRRIRTHTCNPINRYLFRNFQHTLEPKCSTYLSSLVLYLVSERTRAAFEFLYSIIINMFFFSLSCDFYCVLIHFGCHF